MADNDNVSPELDVGHADTPAQIKYQHLVEHIHDAVVEFELLDGEPIVQSVNAAFEDVFGYDAADLRGSSLDEWIVPDWQTEQATALNERTAAGQVNYDRVKRETADGLREFLYRGIPIESQHVRTDGLAVYTDLTDITRHQRRLQVLNRVVRHDLRNKVNIIAMHTTRLLDQLDRQAAETTHIAATIEQATHDLQTLSDEASDIKDIIDADVTAPAIDCVPLVQEVVGAYRQQHPAASIRTDLPASLEVTADSRLQFAIESLVDNALTHNPADDPTVRVRADAADSEGWATIGVADDGPAIPAEQQEVIAGETPITPTQHGSGLGLWLAKWTTELFGGELRFLRSDLGGNSVRLRLPRS